MTLRKEYPSSASFRSSKIQRRCQLATGAAARRVNAALPEGPKPKRGLQLQGPKGAGGQEAETRAMASAEVFVPAIKATTSCHKLHASRVSRVSRVMCHVYVTCRSMSNTRRERANGRQVEEQTR